MTEQERKAWINHNHSLQQAYQQYYCAYSTKEKDNALKLLSIALEWPPFMNYCYNAGGLLSGIIRYGLDSVTERCIGEINKIANGEMDYEY
jgi:hypothetical protein